MTGSWRSRTVAACVLVGFGVLLLVAAVLMPTFMLGRLARIPLDLEITTVAQTPDNVGADVLDTRSLTSTSGGAATIDHNVPLIQQRFLTVEDPSNAAIATLQAGQTLRRNDRQGDTGLLIAMVDRVTVNRKTAQPVADPIGSIQAQFDNADEVAHTGLQYRFPFHTKATTYQFFDVNARAAFPIHYVGRDEVNDLWTYHFTQTVPPVDESNVINSPTNKMSLPAAKWGIEGGSESVTMTRWYTNQRDVWVEPKTGVIVKERERPYYYYGRSADKPELTSLKGDLTFDENTIESQVAAAKRGLDRLSLYGRVVPLTMGVVGLIALLVGLVMGFRHRDDRGGIGRHYAPTTGPDDADTTPAADSDATEVFPRV
jgi:hypothetical protein